MENKNREKWMHLEKLEVTLIDEKNEKVVKSYRVNQVNHVVQGKEECV